MALRLLGESKFSTYQHYGGKKPMADIIGTELADNLVGTTGSDLILGTAAIRS
jgi:hypothetical protein